MGTITSANSVFTLILPTLYPVPQVLQGYAADDAFAADAVDWAETVMGVDGKMSAGYTPNVTKMTISFQPDSASIQVFDFWLGAMKVAQEVYFASGTIQLPSVGKSYTLTNGVLTSAKPLPDAKKVLQPMQYGLTWESVNVALV